MRLNLRGKCSGGSGARIVGATESLTKAILSKVRVSQFAALGILIASFAASRLDISLYSVSINSIMWKRIPSRPSHGAEKRDSLRSAYEQSPPLGSF